MGMAQGWKYQKYTYEINAFASYDKYADFASVYVNQHIQGLDNYFLFINFINNTNNNRAAIYHTEYITSGKTIADIGERVGARFSGNYGADVYSGCTIEVYVSTDMPTISYYEN